MYSLIVFSERCEIKKMSVTAKNTWVFKRDELYAYVRAIWDSAADRLSESEVEQIYQILQILTNVDDATKDAHVENIRNRFYVEESNEVQPVQSQTTECSQEMLKGEQTQICPKCGANLILRTAKKGSNAGNQFWGCSNFPKCRFIKNV
jgi:rRNA maturation endonuclease Nob1